MTIQKNNEIIKQNLRKIKKKIKINLIKKIELNLENLTDSEREITLLNYNCCI